MVVRNSHWKRRRVSLRQTSSTHIRLEPLEERTLLDAGLTPQLLLMMGSGEYRSVRFENLAQASAAMAAYRADPQVQGVELDPPVSIARLPDDPSVGSLWAMNNTGQTGGRADADIDAAEAWDVHTGSLRTAVAIIDTGIDYTHPDLYKNIWLNQAEIPAGLGLADTDGDGLYTFWDLNDAANAGKVYDSDGNGRIDGRDVLDDRRWANGRDDDGNGRIDDLIGWDFVNDDNDPFDDNGHGTHVAGTIGAMGDNRVGVAGVNWKASLVPLKFLDGSGSGYTSDAVNALKYALGKGIKISNNSWGGTGYSSAMAAALAAAETAGHIFIAAAGNDASNNDTTPFFPANYGYANVLAVAATDSSDRLSSFSNYGASSVDLAAPGSGILSTTPNGTYSIYSGTSMATPHAAGTIALAWDAQPNWGFREVLAKIKSGVDVLSSLAGRVATGGRLNVFNAIIAPDQDTTGPRIVSAVPNGTRSVSSVRVTFSETIDAVSFTASDILGFTGPKGAIAVKSVKAVVGSNQTQFDVIFAKQTAVGTYQFQLGPNITDTSGNRMDQNANGVSGEAADAFRVVFRVAKPSRQTFVNNTIVPIEDLATASSTITVSQDILVTDVNVVLNIAHTYDADLYIYLVGPDGVRVNLVSGRGGSRDHFTKTILTDEASRPIRNGAAPFSGTYRPEQPLSAFDGKNARGDWKLFVEDRYFLDTGSIESWSLVLTGVAAPQLESAAAAAISPQAVDAAMAPATVPSLFRHATTLSLSGQAATPSVSRDVVTAYFSLWRWNDRKRFFDLSGRPRATAEVRTSAPPVAAAIYDSTVASIFEKPDSPLDVTSSPEAIARATLARYRVGLRGR